MLNYFFAGFYAPCSHSQVSNHLTLHAESLPYESSEQSDTPTTSRGNRNKCSVPGILYNTNTLEDFHNLDRQSLLKAEAKKVSHPDSFDLISRLQDDFFFPFMGNSFQFGCLTA